MNAGGPFPAVGAVPPATRGRSSGSRLGPNGRKGLRGAPGLYDYGALGNLRTAALASRFGGIDWLCLPQFASPSVFARLLDARSGGHFDLAPVERFESEQTYLPSTNILLTRFFLTGDRQLDLLDFMPVRPGGDPAVLPYLVRIAEARGGPVPIAVELLPRFRYAAEAATWEERGPVFAARGAEDRIWVRPSTPLAIDGERAGGRYPLAAEGRFSIELGWGDSPSEATAAELLLRETSRFWQGWVHPPTTPIHRIAGLWHTWVERSELVLKMLSVEGTGAFLAAPTTSLPEWPGGTRNWDYRYVWVRDAAFCAQALLLLGHYEEAERFLLWILDRVGPDDRRGHLRVMYPAQASGDLTEIELGHLEGFERSRPVRVGNAAERQFQLDIYGELLDAARLLALRRPGAVRPYWPRLAHFTEQVVERWREPDHGIWESRAPPRQYVHSKVMAWVALDRSLDLAHRFEATEEVARWGPVRDEIQAWVLSEGLDRPGGAFLQAAGEPAIDAVNLRIPLVGFLPYEDPRVRATVARVRRELAKGPFVYRYRGPDGIEGPEGTFLPAAFWLVECLARLGERRLAMAHFRKLLLVASPLGLYPEEYDPVRRRPLGNFPQALTHIGVLRAAVALGAMEMPSFVAPKTEAP